MDEQRQVTTEGDLAEENVALVLRELRVAFGFAMLVPVGDAGPVIGVERRTAHWMSSRGQFPVPVVREPGRKAMVRVVDLARYVAGAPMAGKPKKGRPTKAEQIARRKAAEGKEARS